MATACRRDPPIEPDAAAHHAYEPLYAHYREIIASPLLRISAVTAEPVAQP
jgi:hypothetical protein